MEYRSLGRTGLKVSELCLGTMQFGWTATEEQAFEILDAAWAAGVNFIDTADIYSIWVEGNPGGVAETIIGRWLKRSAIPRSQVVIATKVRGRLGSGPDDEGLSRAHIFKAVEGSLRRLNLDAIDLYQAHWYDENIPIEETLSAFDDLVRQGKVRCIGCSNYPAWRLTEALWTSRLGGLARYDSLQPHYNLAYRAEFERELAQVCQAYQLGVLPYSPLAAGFLSGKYRPEGAPESARLGRVRRYFNPRGWALLDAMQAIARDRASGVTVSQVALAWLLADPLITSPIIGPRSLDQLHDNLGAAGLRLSAEEKQRLDQVSAWDES
jgi:aryl-alcohol dehydrogenase-like predicted oxidoreductase